jgi:flagellar motor protein MotB
MLRFRPDDPHKGRELYSGQGTPVDEDKLTDETIAWPSYVDFLSTFAFVLLLFMGGLSYLLTGALASRQFKRQIAYYRNKLKHAGISSWIEGRQLHINMENQLSFVSGKANIEPKYIPALRTVGHLIAEAPGPPRRIVVAGYADRQPFAGDPFGNWNLSARRAEAVVKFFYLCQDCGYKTDIRSKLVLIGEGDTSADQEVKNNALDRRVDVILDYRYDTSR